MSQPYGPSRPVTGIALAVREISRGGMDYIHVA
jgi:hypothetical protein